MLACDRCGHRFAHGGDVQPEALGQIYENADYRGFRDDPYFTRIIRHELRTTFARIVPKGRILDVGCGNGTFLVEAQARGYEVCGIDISATAVSICGRRGIRAILGDFPSIPLDGTWDVVTMWDVIEHLPNPRDFVARAYEVLVPGGWLVLKTPYLAPATLRLVSLLPRLDRVFVQYPGHIQYFTSGSLSWMVHAVGFPNLTWKPSRMMRGRRAVTSVRALVGRVVRVLVHSWARNGNLYALARKPHANDEGLSTAVTQDI